MATELEKPFYRITEAGRMLGCSNDWLREAEQLGRLPPSRRDLNGWRVYTPSDIERIKAIMVPEEK